MTDRRRVILIVGASSGIGRAAAHAAAARHDHLVLSSRGKSPLDAAAAECRRRGAASVAAHPADVRDEAAVSSLVAAVVAEHGRIDAVFHTAGVVAYGRFEDIPTEIFNGVQDINVRGAANVARAVLPIFRRQQHGHLLLLGSIVGDMAVPGMTPYVLSKHAIRSLGRQLALENRDLPDVHITVVSPGSVDTPIYRQAANYSGRAGRPPAPVARPEGVADAMLAALDRPRDRISVGRANLVMRAGFSLLPKIFDNLIGPLVRLAATRPGTVQPTEGNVLQACEDREAVRGGENQGLSDLVARARGR
jgi:short-subunit dehydrogenase